MTRRDRVRALLRQHGELCSLEGFYQGRLQNGRNEIKPLRDEGWVIEDVWSTHDGVTHKHYRVVVDPARKAQQSAFSFAPT